MKTKETALISRLTSAMKDSNINARELAEKAGVGQSFVYDILNGKSKNPTIQKLTSIARILNISVLYLVYGDDENPSADTFPNNMLSIAQIFAHKVDKTKSELKTLNTGTNLFHSTWIEQELKANPKDLRIVKIHGDYMYPTLSEGDIVIIDTSKTSPSPAGIFALFDGIGINIKRIELLGSSTDKNICITSDNNKYKPYETSYDSLHILGRVVWLSRAII